MSASKIPSKEEFERASRLRAHRDRNWNEITTAAKAALAPIFDLHEFAIFPNDCSFAAILFFKTEEGARAAADSDAATRAREVLLDVIRPFRRECPEIEISIELDSHESVQANYHGSYFFRLR